MAWIAPYIPSPRDNSPKEINRYLREHNRFAEQFNNNWLNRVLGVRKIPIEPYLDEPKENHNAE